MHDLAGLYPALVWRALAPGAPAFSRPSSGTSMAFLGLDLKVLAVLAKVLALVLGMIGGPVLR